MRLDLLDLQIAKANLALTLKPYTKINSGTIADPSERWF